MKILSLIGIVLMELILEVMLHMKKEVLMYCPYVNENNVIVTGTPQFESHFDASLIKSKAEFFEENNLDLNKKYICYSGDDIVTSPLDQYYLEDYF